MSRTSKCALRVRSNILAAAEIYAVMHAESSSRREAEEPISRLNPTPHGDALVIYDSSLPPELPLEQHIAEVLRLVSSRTSELRALRETCEIELFCMFASESGQGSCELSPELLRELAALAVPLIIDLYPSSAG